MRMLQLQARHDENAGAAGAPSFHRSGEPITAAHHAP